MVRYIEAAVIVEILNVREKTIKSPAIRLITGRRKRIVFEIEIRLLLIRFSGLNAVGGSEEPAKIADCKP